MKSLFSIVKNLSESEVKSFRRIFLTSKRAGENKKRLLFDALVKSGNVNDFKRFVVEQQGSRQNYYQLSKRLREDLYDFLLSFHHVKSLDEHFYEEMACYKKLYCVKVLLDRNMQAAAGEILREITNIADKHHLPGIYYEALDLKNRYFPFIELSPPSSCNSVIKDVEQGHHQNEYFRQYLVESILKNHNNDVDFRGSLLNLMSQHSGNSDLMSKLNNINASFYQKCYEDAYMQLKSLKDHLEKPQRQPALMLGLVCLELVKACICLGSYNEAKVILSCSSYHLGRSSPWAAIIYELDYIIALRSFNDNEQVSLLNKVYKVSVPEDRDQFAARWNLYAAYHYYQRGDLKEVIKLTNAKITNSLKDVRKLFLAKLLELICIHQLNDQDWFYYRAECFRKQLGEKVAQPDRIHMLFGVLRKLVDKPTNDKVQQKFQDIERTVPWHPLSAELVNLSQVMVAQLPVVRKEEFLCEA